MVVVVNYQINIVGDDFSENELNQRFKILGELIINEVKKKIKQMNLITDGGGSFLQNWFTTISNGELLIENTQEYALYLEYGTYTYFDINGFDNYTDPMQPKKKDLTREQRKAYPKGMQSFAPVRKVLYDKNLMLKLISEAFS